MRFIPFLTYNDCYFRQFLMHISIAPGPIVGLTAIAPEGSDTILTVSWSTPLQSSSIISQYYVTVTNYSLAPVTNVTVPGERTSINVTGLGKCYG